LRNGDGKPTVHLGGNTRIVYRVTTVGMPVYYFVKAQN